eukprot:6178445-Pleurochrysis_carterae.AAC.1
MVREAATKGQLQQQWQPQAGALASVPVGQHARCTRTMRVTLAEQEIIVSHRTTMHSRPLPN